MNPCQLGGDFALAWMPPRIPSVAHVLQDAVTHYQQNDQVPRARKKQEKMKKEGQLGPQKQQKHQRGTDSLKWSFTCKTVENAGLLWRCVVHLRFTSFTLQ